MKERRCEGHLQGASRTAAGPRGEAARRRSGKGPAGPRRYWPPGKEWMPTPLLGERTAAVTGDGAAVGHRPSHAVASSAIRHRATSEVDAMEVHVAHAVEVNAPWSMSRAGHVLASAHSRDHVWAADCGWSRGMSPVNCRRSASTVDKAANGQWHILQKKKQRRGIGNFQMVNRKRAQFEGARRVMVVLGACVASLGQKSLISGLGGTHGSLG